MPEKTVDDYDFTGGDSGAALTEPCQGGDIRKGGLIMIKGHPCKVTDVSTSKTGKHGHAKCHFVAIDIFTGKKMEDLVPSTHNTEVPVVSRKEYTLLDINEDGEVSLMDDAGTQKSDINLPEWNPDPKYVEMLVAAFEDGQTITVTVQRALGMEMIVSHKIDQEG